MTTAATTSRPRRRRRAAAATAAAVAATVGLVGWLAIALAWDCVLSADGGASQWDSTLSRHPVRYGRRPLSLPQSQLPPGNACTPRSIETFPPDLFSLAEKRRGAVLLHGAAALWLLVGLAIVCDDYFVVSLEVLCDVLRLKPDVAGATFMAAGSSAPELFTSVIGVFFTQSDVGISTIVGSAVFNLLFIVSLCGIFATQTIFLSWWPMFRDCGYYSLSVVGLILVIYNEEVRWYEATAFLILYAVYIVIMYFNETIDQWISARWPSLATGGNQRHQEAVATGKVNGHSLVLATPNGTVTYSPLQTQPDKEDEPQEEPEDAEAPEKQAETRNTAEQAQMTEVDLQQSSSGLGCEVSSSYESPLLFPDGWLKRAYWCISLPWTLVFMLTIPDCRRPGRWRKVFFITLFNSIVWIGGMSYLLVWMVCAVGDTLGVPDTVMGLTLLAAGTSVPDALASVFVARDGFGDMAVSNSVGSNVFDILIGLGLPWFIGTAVRSPGSAVTINSAGLTYSSVVLLSTVLLLFVTVYANKMRLDRRLGVACMLLYLVFITVSVLFETNVFAMLNPPPCQRTRD